MVAYLCFSYDWHVSFGKKFKWQCDELILLNIIKCVRSWYLFFPYNFLMFMMTCWSYKLYSNTNDTSSPCKHKLEMRLLVQDQLGVCYLSTNLLYWIFHTNCIIILVKLAHIFSVLMLLLLLRIIFVQKCCCSWAFRSKRSLKMNDAASRSHFFFTAYIHGKNEVCFCYDLWVLDKLFEFSLVIE